MQKHATTMPMIQKEKALWPARTRTIHAAAMSSYSMQISAVFAKLSFKQHQTFVPSFQFWNNNCKSEPYLSESLIKTYQSMLRGLSASLKCVLDKLRQHSAPNNPRQRKHCVQHKLRLWQMCGLGLKTKSWEGPIPAGLQKKQQGIGNKKMPATRTSQPCKFSTLLVKASKAAWNWMIFLLGDSIYLVERAVRKNATWQLAINSDQMGVLAQCNFYRARKNMKTWYGANKAAKQLQSRCQKLALGQHPSSCSCRNWIKSVMPCLLTSPDGSVFRARCFLPLF